MASACVLFSPTSGEAGGGGGGWAAAAAEKGATFLFTHNARLLWLFFFLKITVCRVAWPRCSLLYTIHALF